MSDYFVHKSSFVDEGAIIGNRTKIWHFCHIRSTAKIGKDCVFGQNCYVGVDVVVGNNVHAQNNVSIYEKVVLEDDVFLGPSMVFTNDLIPRSKYPKASSDEYLETYVEKGATIGANATIVCGVRIGKYSLIGAGAVVIEDVKPHSVVVGNPAKHIRWICECGGNLHIEDSKSDIICVKCKKRYILKDDFLKLKEK
jgi:UDP-2-acetamido-3-amino-2,3-dideoxy-glucuronate N-acetyltransferase